MYVADGIALNDWFHFCGKHVMHSSSIIGCLITLPKSDGSRYGDRFLIFEEMFQNVAMGYSPENLEYISYYLMHFLASIKYLNQYREINSIRELDIVQKSILFMRDHLEEKINLQELTSNFRI